MNTETKKVVNKLQEELLLAWYTGKITLLEIEEMQKEAEQDEEYEIALVTKCVIEAINIL